MIEVYNELGMAAYESITEPPYADNDLADAVARFRKDMTLIGNLDQITFLRTASPEQVRRKCGKNWGSSGAGPGSSWAPRISWRKEPRTTTCRPWRKR